MREDVPSGGKPIRRDPPAGSLEGRAHGAVARFLGIPFAQAPVGALRFAAPVRRARWKDVRPAVRFGPTMAQPHRDFTLIPEPEEAGEDTLHLNVFAPSELPPDRLPVLVYIHGGGFFSGCNRSPWFDGAPFVENGVLVVTPAYRLGVEGFMPVEGAPDNRGLRDCIAALHWVRENIGAFGGDPERVTISGQSAGAGMVAALMAAPSAKGLFHRGFLISGSIGFGGSLETARAFARRFEKATGRKANAKDLADLPRETLVAGYEAAMVDPSATGPGEGFLSTVVSGLPMQPLAGTDSLPLSPALAFAKGAGNDIPLLITTTSEEFVFEFDQHGDGIKDALLVRELTKMGLDSPHQTAFRAHYEAHDAAYLTGQAVTDFVFRAPMLKLAASRKSTGANAPTWLAEFRWQSPVVLDAPMRAAHCFDMPFYFDKLDLESARFVLGNNAPKGLSTRMHAAVVSFVKGEALEWQPWAESETVQIWDWPEPASGDAMTGLKSIWL